MKEGVVKLINNIENSGNVLSFGKKLLDLLVVLTLAFVFPLVASYTANIIAHDYYKISWLYVHHFVQMVLAVLVILLPIWKKSLPQWGFNLNDRAWSLRTVKKFCIGWLVFLPIGTLIFQWLSGWPPLISYPLTLRNIAGHLSFMFTMPGLSEEILFRALTMGILLRSWQGKIRFMSIEVSSAGLIAAIIFTLAHIGFTLNPFRITYYQPMQLLFAFCLGIFYAVMFDKTRSLLGPILVHNASDGLGTVIYMVISFFTRN